MDTSPSLQPIRFRSTWAFWLLLAALVPVSLLADSAKKVRFDLPADAADRSLRRFSLQSGLEVIFATAAPSGVKTNPVHGEYSPEEAVRRLLEGTGLTPTQDPPTGAIMVNRAPDAKKQRSALTEPAASRNDVADARRETITMTPFQVESTAESGYGAINSNSITQFKEELFKLPVTAEIFTETFMKDILATSVEDMITEYNPGSGIALSSPQGVPSVESYERLADSSVSIRGLYTPNYQRDGFIPLNTYSTSSTTGTGFSSNFDLERVEVLKGPQSMLYGSGGGGGVMNMVSKQARLGKPAFGSLRFVVDEHGHKLGQFDYGYGTRTAAVRVAAIRQTTGGRRVDIGGPLQGYYGQVAVKVFGNTEIRVMNSTTRYRTMVPWSATFTAASTANDARNGRSLVYLLATNQIEASATGPSGAGVIGNGKITWDNVNSYGGDQRQEFTKDSISSLTVETTWTPSLSTNLSVGYKDYMTRFASATSGIIAPNVASNPLGVWAAQRAGAAEDRRGAKAKAIRFAIYSNNSFFGGRARSQSVLGTEYSRVTPSFESFLYYKKGTTPFSTPRSTIPAVYYPVDQGPQLYPIAWRAFSQTVVLNGEEYYMDSQNPPDPARISESNPLGVIPGGGSFYRLKTLSWGTYGANSTEWLNGRLNTLAGFRLANYKQEMLYNGVAPKNGNTFPRIVNEKKNKLSVEVGANYAIRHWLRAYAAVSGSHNPTVVQRFGPVGDVPQSGEAFGEEIGLKVQTPGGSVSGSLAAFHVDGKNELLQTPLRSVINPGGLNGDDGAPGAYFNGDRKVVGVEATVTANPVKNWRIRFAAAWTDGQIGTDKSYTQVYNDQFYQNALGQVTYKDGAIVYVNPNAISTTAPTVPAGTPGAVPLTVAAMSTPSNLYYANPVPLTGHINGSSNAARVLRVVDPVHGPILTGVTGLPLSEMQINPGFALPENIVVAQSGDVTANHAEYSFNATSLYTFSSGLLNRFRIGGTAVVGMKNRGYYYYPTTDTSPSAQRILFYRPDTVNFNVIAGYSYKWKRYTWSTQLNINNVFNRYDVAVYPTAIGGYSVPGAAGFTRDPRSYRWTNSLEF